MNADSRNSKDLNVMIDHWINTPENGYLGSSYGFAGKLLEITRIPQSQENTKIIEDKLKLDIPILATVKLATSWMANANEITFSINGTPVLYKLKRGA